MVNDRRDESDEIEDTQSKNMSIQEDQAADTERLQPTISTHLYVATTGNLILLVLVLAPQAHNY
jgi:hypothetical protein